jgi:hypothetical protein
MYALLFATLAAAPAQPATDSADKNAIFKRLTTDGLDVGGNVKIKFPAPTMPDGLAAAKQTDVIKGVIGTDFSFDEFMRKSVEGRIQLKISNLKGANPQTPARQVDVWFVAYGDFKKFEDDKFLDKLIGANSNNNTKGVQLTAADLMKRGIAAPNAKANESYGTIEFDFLEKVRLKATGHAMWSRSGESVVAAAEIDPRFLNDKEFPNQWASIVQQGGQKAVGPANPWSGAAMYLKITKLQEPAGAMFIEQHIVFVEPHGWFEGKPILTSKLPQAVKMNVKNIRVELDKASK